jgi:hypothetical protein
MTSRVSREKAEIGPLLLILVTTALNSVQPMRFFDAQVLPAFDPKCQFFINYCRVNVAVETTSTVEASCLCFASLLIGRRRTDHGPDCPSPLQTIIEPGENGPRWPLNRRQKAPFTQAPARPWGQLQSADRAVVRIGPADDLPGHPRSRPQQPAHLHSQHIHSGLDRRVRISNRASGVCAAFASSA